MTNEREPIVFRGSSVQVPTRVDLLKIGTSFELPPPGAMLHTVFSGTRNDFFTINVNADGCRLRYDSADLPLTKGETKKMFIREFPPGQYSWEEERSRARPSRQPA